MLRKSQLAIAFVVLAMLSAGATEVLPADPTGLSVGARVLGMGGSFVGVADDPSAIFINPGGLGLVRQGQLSSMFGKYFNRSDYWQLSGLYPTGFGTFGLGYSGSMTELHLPSSEVIIIGGEKRLIPTGEVVGRYANTALLLSYGRAVELPWLNKLSLGGSLKLLSQDLSATGVTGGTASGVELNIGALYPLNDDLNLGLAVHNALPASMGGKFSWSDGTEVSLPAMLRAGGSYHSYMLNKTGEKEYKQLILSFDYDSYLTRSGLPGLMHAGVEWLPVEFLAFRAGVDQGAAADSGGVVRISNDLTLGLGLLLGDFRFDYAHHTYQDLSEKTTSYFSFSYVPIIMEERATDDLVVLSPAEQAVFYQDKATIKGRVQGKGIKLIVINGDLALIDHQGNFSVEVDLEPGRNRVLVQGYGQKGELLKQAGLRLVRLVPFSDLDRNYWARLPVEQLATLGIITGYPDGSFKPEATINRAELVTLLMKMMGKSQGGVTIAFKDVPKNHWAYQHIQEAVRQGMVTGYPDGTFKPARAISRAEGISVIARFAQLPEFPVKDIPFVDVPGRHWAVKAVSSAKQAGYLDFIKTGKYLPETKLRRGETAYILSRIDDVKLLIKEMMGGQ